MIQIKSTVSSKWALQLDVGWLCGFRRDWDVPTTKVVSCQAQDSAVANLGLEFTWLRGVCGVRPDPHRTGCETEDLTCAAVVRGLQAPLDTGQAMLAISVAIGKTIGATKRRRKKNERRRKVGVEVPQLETAVIRLLTSSCY